jgi:SAM-dependent methyltransferase
MENNRGETFMQSYKQTPQKAKCPICCTDAAHLLWDVDSKKAAQHFILKEKSPNRSADLSLHIGNLWGQNTCEIVQCDRCGFCFSNPYVAGDERFYSLAYVRSSYPKWKWEFQVTYDVLSKKLCSNAKLIEIGAGDGAFIKRIMENILPKENILCTEFSEYGRNQIEKFGVSCLSEDVRYLSSAELEGSTDVICMFQVLEHMDKLDVLFQKLNWLLKRKGSLFIAVPNQNRIEFNELNGALLDMPPNHIGRWNKRCFEEIGRRYGFYIEDYKIENYSFASMANQFVKYRFLRNSQRSGTFSNKIQKIRNRYLLKMVQVIGFMINFIAALPVLTKMNSKLGNSQWVHLIKN